MISQQQDRNSTQSLLIVYLNFILECREPAMTIAYSIIDLMFNF